MIKKFNQFVNESEDFSKETDRLVKKHRSYSMPSELKASSKSEIMKNFHEMMWLRKYTEDPRFEKVIQISPVDLKGYSINEMEKLVNYILELKTDLKKFGFQHGFTFLNRYLNKSLVCIAYEENRILGKIKNPALVFNTNINHLKDDFFLPGQNLDIDI
jgi:hypothetical protein